MPQIAVDSYCTVRFTTLVTCRSKLNDNLGLPSWLFEPSGMLHCLARRVVTEASEDRRDSIFRVEQSKVIFVGIFDSGEEGFTVFRKWGWGSYVSIDTA